MEAWVNGNGIRLNGLEPFQATSPNGYRNPKQWV